MTQYKSEKPLKNCNICGKEVRNLGLHIANIHPNVLDELEQRNETTHIEHPIHTEKPAVSGNISGMIKEKLETMLNIKIIEMLSRGAEFKEINQILHPQENKPVGIAEIKQYHDLIYKEKEQEPNINLNVGDAEGSGWVNLLNNALPIIAQMLQSKQTNLKDFETEDKKDVELRTIETGTLRPIKIVSGETARDTTEPTRVGEESGTIGESEQPNSFGVSGDVKNTE